MVVVVARPFGVALWSDMGDYSTARFMPASVHITQRSRGGGVRLGLPEAVDICCAGVTRASSKRGSPTPEISTRQSFVPSSYLYLSYGGN